MTTTNAKVNCDLCGLEMEGTREQSVDQVEKDAIAEGWTVEDGEDTCTDCQEEVGADGDGEEENDG